MPRPVEGIRATNSEIVSSTLTLGAKMKCIVDNCKNEDWQGQFKGTMCFPCFNFCVTQIENREKNGSQAYVNHINKCLAYLRQNEYYLISEKYKDIE